MEYYERVSTLAGSNEFVYFNGAMNPGWLFADGEFKDAQVVLSSIQEDMISFEDVLVDLSYDEEERTVTLTNISGRYLDVTLSQGGELDLSLDLLAHFHLTKELLNIVEFVVRVFKGDAKWQIRLDH
jgi:hypothetical protein